MVEADVEQDGRTPKKTIMKRLGTREFKAHTRKRDQLTIATRQQSGGRESEALALNTNNGRFSERSRKNGEASINLYK